MYPREQKGLRERGANIMTLPFSYDCLEGRVTLFSYDAKEAPGYAMELTFKCLCETEICYRLFSALTLHNALKIRTKPF